jgi:hypothetical protein
MVLEAIAAGNNLKVAAAAPATHLRPDSSRVFWKQEGAKKRENWRNSKGFRAICPRQNRYAGFRSDHPELRRTSPCYL